MAENVKMLSSAKSAFCGSTSAISKNCGSTKKNKKVVLPQKIWMHPKFFVDPQFSEIELVDPQLLN